jgi:hypothetical protein
MGDQPVGRPLPTHRRTQTQNKCTWIQISMTQVGFERTILVFERAKTVHALDRAATVIAHFLTSTASQSLMPLAWQHKLRIIHIIASFKKINSSALSKVLRKRTCMRRHGISLLKRVRCVSQNAHVEANTKPPAPDIHHRLRDSIIRAGRKIRGRRKWVFGKCKRITYAVTLSFVHQVSTAAGGERHGYRTVQLSATDSKMKR